MLKMSTEVVTVPCPAPVLSAAVIRADQRTRTRLLEFFTVHIRNPITRAAYGRAAASFRAWCEARELGDFTAAQPIHVAAYIEELQAKLSKPTVKEHLPLFACCSTGW
jgi:glutamine amidotransferase PdxT